MSRKQVMAGGGGEESGVGVGAMRMDADMSVCRLMGRLVELRGREVRSLGGYRSIWREQIRKRMN
jgi:hypothetical protein